jgi:hypothetical protein
MMADGHRDVEISPMAEIVEPVFARIADPAEHARLFVADLQSFGMTGRRERSRLLRLLPEFWWGSGLVPIPEKIMFEALGRLCKRRRVDAIRDGGTISKDTVYQIPPAPRTIADVSDMRTYKVAA